MKQSRTLSRRLRKLTVTSGIALAVLGPGTTAFAADYPDGGSTTTIPSDRGEVDPAQVAAKTQTRGGLPFTGGDVAGVAAIGLGAVVIGGGLTAHSRRRRADAKI